MSHKIHEDHEHVHSAGCGHTAVEHEGHTDYLHDGHLHHPHGDHVDEHRIAVSRENPEDCTPDHACEGHEEGHVHGEGCGHEAVPHGDHVDYLVDGHLHRPHGDHCDDHGPLSQASKVAGREPIRLHPADAARRGIADGDVVRVFNDRGACLAGAVLDDAVMQGVAQLATGAWYDPVEPGAIGSLDRHGNANLLTLDKGTSRLAQGPIAQTALVEIERFADAAPEITVFDPPAGAS